MKMNSQLLSRVIPTLKSFEASEIRLTDSVRLPSDDSRNAMRGPVLTSGDRHVPIAYNGVFGQSKSCKQFFAASRRIAFGEVIPSNTPRCVREKQSNRADEDDVDSENMIMMLAIIPIEYSYRPLLLPLLHD